MGQGSLVSQSVSSDETNDLIERLLAEIEKLNKALEKYEQPKKTRKSSSLPPAQTEKGNLKRKAKGKRSAQ